jgi:hypothetical protein
LKRINICLAVCCIAAAAGRTAFAQQKGPDEAMAQGIVDTVAKGCEKELKIYCKDIPHASGSAGHALPG